MTRCLSIAALLLVAACSKQDQSPAPSNEAANTAEAPADEATVPTLEGSWRVAMIDGRPVAEASAMVATFAGGKLTVASGCVRRAWTYSQKRNVVSFADNPGGSDNCGSGTSSQQETAYAAFTKASMAIFNKDGSEANLSGTGGGLTLRRR
jgi:hypothetical protein